MRIAEGFDNFTQGFTRFANNPTDFLHFVTQFLARFYGFLVVRDLAISVESLCKLRMPLALS